ncbi:hypothetical protein UFOVP45_103 [uncultured Caudovirales phage]|uniref:Uncharacterized protein n=1 Tax=uncultured Caudovirales phage TaxID=2100421 RepID=A0A6J5KSJ2_9CAUD|nr:hypothetical protein UFOVP45_103 [uncultured Caudovirales phage]
MSEQEALRQGIMFGKRAMLELSIMMFEKMKSQDPTDTPYSISNTLTIDEVINALRELES